MATRLHALAQRCQQLRATAAATSRAAADRLDRRAADHHARFASVYSVSRDQGLSGDQTDGGPEVPIVVGLGGPTIPGSPSQI